jgi:hypothetical protein
VFGLIVRIVIGYAIGNIVAGVLLASRQAAALPHSAHDLAMIAGGVVFACLAWLTSGQARRGVGSTVHGSARFASEKEAKAGLGGPRGLIVGRENRRGGKLMRYAGPAHLLTIAPTRSGKGVGAIIPNLLLADRSVLCIDPKGENARVTTRARRRFGPVHVLGAGHRAGACRLKKSGALYPVKRLRSARTPLPRLSSALPQPTVGQRSPPLQMQPSLEGPFGWFDWVSLVRKGLGLPKNDWSAG